MTSKYDSKMKIRGTFPDKGKTWTRTGLNLSPQDVETLRSLLVPPPEQCSEKVKESLPDMNAQVDSMLDKPYRITVEYDVQM